MRASQLRGLVRRGAPTRFLTLTIRFLDGDDPDAKARELARAWRLLRERIKKHFKVKKVSFLAVWEATKRGAPHLHIFLRGRFIKHEWLSQQMDDLIGSPVVSIEKIDNRDKAANYVTKYVTKANRTFNGCKRYWRSQDYEPPEKRYVKPEDPAGTYWTKSSGTDYQTVAGLVEAGWSAWPQKSYWILIPPGMDPPDDLGLGRSRKVS